MLNLFSKAFSAVSNCGFFRFQNRNSTKIIEFVILLSFSSVMSNSGGNLNSNGGNENPMSDGELSSETESKMDHNERQTLQVEKTSADFEFSENRSEGEVSDTELAPGSLPVSHEATDRDNPWTQAAMGNYPALPFSREAGEEWTEESVQVWNEYYTRAMEQVKINRRKKKDPVSQQKAKRRKGSKTYNPVPKEEVVRDKTEDTQEMQIGPPLNRESDESSDFEFEEREEQVSLSDVITQNTHIDLAVFAGEDQEMLKGKRNKIFLQGTKKRKKKKRYGRANNIRQECKQEYWSQDKFRSTVMQPQFCIDTTVCMYWKMYGYCNKGDACGYSHLPQLKGVAPPTKRIPDVCKFYLQDSCQKGTNCNYYHQEFPCKFFHIGLTCYQGNGCKFSHAPLNEETSKLLEKAWTANKPRSVSRETEQPPDTSVPALYSAVPPGEQGPPPPPPTHFALSSPPPPSAPMGFSRPQMDPQRYPFSHGPIFDPPGHQMMPHQFPYRPSRPYMHMTPRFPPTQFPRGTNRFPTRPPEEPTPPAYHPISYESDDPGQPPVSPLSFLSDDAEERVLTIDAGGSPAAVILSPKHSNIDLLFQADSPTQPGASLSRSDSVQSDPRLRKGSKRGSLSDTPESFSRSLSREGIRSPDLFSDPPDIPPLLSPEPPPRAISPEDKKPTPAELQYEMPLLLRDPAALTKPLDPRVLFQNVAKKSDLNSDLKLTV